MPTKTPIRFTPAMYLNTQRCPYSDGYEFEAKVCFIDTTAKKEDCQLGELTGFGLSFGVPDKWRDLEGFRFHSWIKDDGSAYGCGPSWEAGSYVKLEDVHRMERASTRIERGLEKLRKERGYTNDTAEWFGRVAEVLGCNLFLEAYKRDRPSRSGYRYFTIDSIGDAVNHVRGRLADLKQAHVDANPA